MKIESTAEDFAAALKLLLKPENKPLVSVLAYAKVGVNGITTTNLGMTTTAMVRNSKGEGEFLIPFKKTLDILKSEHGPLVIESDQATGAPKLSENGEPVDLPMPHIVLTVGGAEFKLDSLDVRRFPEVPTGAAATLTIAEKDFQKLLSRVIFAISTEASRYTLDGALFESGNSYLTAVATDGYRLSKALVHADGELDKTIVRLDALKWLKSRKGDVQIGADEHGQTFRVGDVMMASRRVSGQFPSWEAVMPDPAAETVRVGITDPAALLAVLLHVAKCADSSDSTRWEFGKEKSTISAKSIDMRSAIAEIPVSANGEIRIGWNWKLVAEFLKVAGNEPLTLGISDGLTATLWANGYDWDYILMPQRI